MQPPQSPQDRAKRAAGAEAIRRYLKNGMKIGLGSGSTSHWFVRILGERVKEGLEVVGVPTSSGTRDIAREVGVPIADLNDIAPLDLAIDGADEIDDRGRMIKGGGASLLWEKIVACASKKMVAIVDEGKLVTQLGRFPLPIEVRAARADWTVAVEALYAIPEVVCPPKERVNVPPVGPPVNCTA